MNESPSTSALRRADRILAAARARGVRRVHFADPDESARPAIRRHSSNALAPQRSPVTSTAAADLYGQLAAASSGTGARCLPRSRTAGGRLRRHCARASPPRRSAQRRNRAQQQGAPCCRRGSSWRKAARKRRSTCSAHCRRRYPTGASDAAAVRGQALFRVGRPADAVRALVEREVCSATRPRSSLTNA